MRCNNCGREFEQGTRCPDCGTEIKVTPDNGGFGWGLLGCCIPVVGLVLFLVWKNERPRTAKAAGIGALVSVAVGLLSQLAMCGLGIMGSMM